MKNKKPIIALGALAVVGLIAGTIAYFTSEVTFDNVFKTAIYKTKSTETFQSPSNWTPGQDIPKTVVTENEGNVDVAVRTSISQTWYDEDYRDDMTDTEKAEHVIDPSLIPQNAVIIHYSTPQTGDWDWIAHTDGKWYYSKKLAPTQTTSTFINSVELNPNIPVTSVCDNDGTTETVGGQTVTTKTCTTSIAGLGKATYVLTITVETVQYDQYANVWTGAPTISEN